MRNNFYFMPGIILLMLNISAIAQTPHVEFSYDAAGNRILRQYSPLRLMGDSVQTDEQAVQIAQQHGISVYPNPAIEGNIINIAISASDNKTTAASATAVIYLLDNSGKILVTQKQTPSALSQIDMSGYAAGIYYIKVAMDKEQLFYKITRTK